MLSCCLKTDLWLCWCWHHRENVHEKLWIFWKMVAKLVLLFKVKLHCRRDPSCRPCFSSDCRRISVGNNLKSHILSDFWSFHSFRCLGTGTAGWSYRPHSAESQMDRRRLTTAAAISDQQVHQKNHQMCACSLQYPSWEPAWFPPAAALRWWLRFHCVLECTSAFSSSSCWPLPLTWKLFQLTQHLSSEGVAAEALTICIFLSSVHKLLHMPLVKQRFGPEILSSHFCF